jgi:hypothetical protein
MSLRKKISFEDQQKIRKRASNLCEYCHTSEEWQYVMFTIDHIIPVSKGGTNNLDNLCLACFHCNRKKSNKLYTFDPLTDKKVKLFNPRKDIWNDHFIWSCDRFYLIGVTPIGRGTISELKLNRERIIHIRGVDVGVKRHPPKCDNIQVSR